MTCNICMFCVVYLRPFADLHELINLSSTCTVPVSVSRVRPSSQLVLGLVLDFNDFPVSEIHSVGDSQFPHLSSKSIVDHNGIQHRTFPIHKMDKENDSRDS